MRNCNNGSQDLDLVTSSNFEHNDYVINKLENELKIMRTEITQNCINQLIDFNIPI